MSAKVPDSVMAAFNSGPRATTRGTALWVKAMDEERREEFDVTLRVYLEGRVNGSINLSLPGLISALKNEFGYPFKTDALRNYMRATYPDLFNEQLLA